MLRHNERSESNSYTSIWPTTCLWSSLVGWVAGLLKLASGNLNLQFNEATVCRLMEAPPPLCWQVQGPRAGTPGAERSSGPDTTNGHLLRDGKNPVESTSPARSPGNGVGSRARLWCLLRATWGPGSAAAWEPHHRAQAYVLIQGEIRWFSERLYRQ